MIQPGQMYKHRTGIYFSILEKVQSVPCAWKVFILHEEKVVRWTETHILRYCAEIACQ